MDPRVFIQGQEAIVEPPPVQIGDEAGAFWDVRLEKGLELEIGGIVELAEDSHGEISNCWLLVGKQGLDLGGPRQGGIGALVKVVEPPYGEEDYEEVPVGEEGKVQRVELRPVLLEVGGKEDVEGRREGEDSGEG